MIMLCLAERLSSGAQATAHPQHSLNIFISCQQWKIVEIPHNASKFPYSVEKSSSIILDGPASRSPLTLRAGRLSLRPSKPPSGAIWEGFSEKVRPPLSWEQDRQVGLSDEWPQRLIHVPWVIDSKMDSVHHIFLSACPLQCDFADLPIKSWIYFPIPWIWTSLTACFG